MTISAIQATTIRGAYDELQPIFKTRARKLQNNTWIRRDGSDIVIKYHATDILTYHGNDTVTINTDGYHTVTTAERFGNWLPRMWSVRNDRGAWNVFGPVPGEMIENAGMYLAFTYPRTVAHFRLWDGMTITDVPRPRVVNYRQSPDFETLDSLARDIGSMIGRYVDLYDAETCASFVPDGTEPTSLAGDCWFCLGMIDHGDLGHLLSHFVEGYVMVSTIRNAYRDRGYGNPDSVLQIDLRYNSRNVRDTLRRYLIRQLIPNGMPTVTGSDLDYAATEAA